MRPGLLTLGIVVLLIGAALYVVPQVLSTSRSYARAPDAAQGLGTLAQYGLPVMGVGALLALAGLVIPRARHDVDTRDYRDGGYRTTTYDSDDDDEQLVAHEVETTRVKDTDGRVLRSETVERKVVRDRKRRA